MKLTNDKKMIRLTIARNTAEAAFAATKKALEAAKETLKEAEMAHNQAKAVYLTVVDAEKLENVMLTSTAHNSRSFFVKLEDQNWVTN